MAETLRDKTVKGVGWSFADSILGQGVSFVVSLVLARLLSPDEYGLIGIITIFVTVFNSIVDSGFSNALIRNNKADDKDYNTAFITNLTLSVVLFFILYISAPFIAQFFRREELVSLTRVMGVVVIINALTLIQNTILTKRIDFKTKTKASLISGILSGAIGITMALMGFGVWSLVAQTISRQVINTVCLWIYNKWYPKLQFCWQSFKAMWGFGWKILVSGLINTIWNELYQVVIGRWYSPATLGQYTRARQFASIFSSNITSVVQRVSYPTLSIIQDEKERLRNAYRKVIKVTMFVTVVIMFSLGAVAKPLIFCLLGPQWDEASAYLPLICVTLSLFPLHAINLNMLQVQGRSDLYLKLEIVKKIIAIFPILLGIFVSIYWMLIGSILSGIISFFLNSYYSGKLINYSSFDQIRDVAPFYAIGIIVGISVYFFRYLPLPDVVVLAIQVAVGAVVLLTICKVRHIPEYEEVKGMAMQYVRKMRERR